MKKTKKVLGVILAALLIAPMAGAVKAYAATDSLNIKDRALKSAILEEVNKDEKNVTKEDLKSVKKLSLNDKGIKSLEGIENCTNLEELEISDNAIVDLNPIKSLKSLKDFRALDCGISDISVLASLTNLENIDLDYNNIYDVTPIMNLNKIKFASLEEQIINLNEVKAASGKVKVQYPVVDGVKNGDIRIYDISDNGVYNASKKQVEWKNIKEDTELNFFFKEHLTINGEDNGRISGIVNVPVKVK